MTRGADLFAKALSDAGVTQLFSVSGNHLMALYDALLSTDIRIIHCRHEAACVHMADAWGRLTGQAGVACVTAAQGHTNAAAALYTALAAESPMVLLSGHCPVAEIGHGSFQEMDQVAFARPVTKASWMSNSSAAMAFDLHRAIAIASSGRPGPVSLSLPADLLEQKIPDDLAERAPRFAAPAPAELDKPFIGRLAARIGEARYPLIVCGPALCTTAGRQWMRDASRKLEIPVIGMESPRGVNDPGLGAFVDILGRSDLIVLMGKPLDFTLKFGGAPIPATTKWAVIDPDSELVSRAHRILQERLELAAVADAKPTLEALVQQGSVSKGSDWLSWAEDALEFRPRHWAEARSSIGGRLHPIEMCVPIAEFLDKHPRATFITDGGEISQWAQAIVKTSRRVINGVAGAIGPAIPSAIAAKLQSPDDPVIVAMGDGTVGFHVAEFDTAIRYNLPFIVVVGNDARWNAEYQIQVREFGKDRAKHCELLPTRYDLVVEGLGGFGALVTDAKDLPDAIERAYRSGKPACINLMIEGVPAPVIRIPQV
jgi:acetolactate synthase-1/2/3 large subunit